MTCAASTVHFAVTAQGGPDAISIELSGELDLAAVEPLERVLAGIELARGGHVTLDLSSLCFIDAVGLRAVFWLRDACRQQAATLTIKRGPRAVQRVFEITHLDALLPFETA